MKTHTKHRRLPALDGVRGLAALMVVLFHLFGRGDHTSSHPILFALTAINSYGWTGVTLFFTLSGFLITGILWDTRDDLNRLRNFYGRRSVRIFPLYYGALLLIVVAAALHGQLRQCLRGVWIYVLYLQNMLPVGQHTATISAYFRTGHFWSLAVEEQFYLVWPFLVYRMRTLKQLRNLCLIVIVASAGFRIAYSLIAAAPSALGDSLVANAGALALGGLLAVSFRGSGWSRMQAWAPAVLASSGIAYLISLRFPGGVGAAVRTHMMVGLLLISIFWAALLVASLSGGQIQRAFEMKWLRWLGGISYGLYVYHLLLNDFFVRLSLWLVPHSGLLVQHFVKGCSGLVISVVVAALSFHWFEEPVSRLKQYFRSPTTTQDEEPAISADSLPPLRGDARFGLPLTTIGT